MAGAVFRAMGSSRMADGATSMAPSCSATMNRCSSLHTTIGALVSSRAASRLAVACNNVSSPSRPISCLGWCSRESGQSLLPAPPERIMGTTRGFTFRADHARSMPYARVFYWNTCDGAVRSLARIGRLARLVRDDCDGYFRHTAEPHLACSVALVAHASNAESYTIPPYLSIGAHTRIRHHIPLPEDLGDGCADTRNGGSTGFSDVQI